MTDLTFSWNHSFIYLFIYLFCRNVHFWAHESFLLDFPFVPGNTTEPSISKQQNHSCNFKKFGFQGFTSDLLNMNLQTAL